MLGWLPRIYEDELLYSILSRYFKQSSHISIRESLHEHFNDSRAVLTPDFPSNLRVFEKKLHIFGYNNLEAFITKHTPFRYFTNFLDKSQKEAVLKEIKNQKSKNVQMLIGTVASTVKESKYFKFCPSCFEEDLEQNSESYWRVYHQLPSVYVCTKHDILLHNSTVLYRNKNSALIIPDNTNCIASLNSKCIQGDLTTKELNLLYKIAIASKRLLSENFEINIKNLSQNYKEMLKEKGYVTINGMVRQTDLFNNFLLFYGERILEILQSNPTSKEGSCWLRSITRKHRKSFPPIRHILLLIFLGKDFNDIETKGFIGPFGMGPFPCLNPAADHFKELVVTDLLVKRCTDTGKPLGIFTCSCEFQYTRLGPDIIDEDKYTYRHVRNYGSVWLDKLMAYIEEKKQSYRKTARLLKVDVGTVIKYFKLQKQGKIEGLPVIENDLIQKEYRNAWITAKDENPTHSKTALRKLIPKVYIWLYRNDRKWLEMNCPESVKGKVNKLRVDWNKRDKEILEQINNFLGTIDEKCRPVRITRRYLAISIDKLSLIEKQIEKLPLTKQYIESITESSTEYKKKLEIWKDNKTVNGD
ncbi:TnsD family transposase [Schinkia azotoformans]|uniref:TnsD family transposase n=1 Tax=Schinkia azotoformans TaxID=1454 RepID=UPI002DB6DD13|nr:TnsD family transposase [Schinkia azotoformans]MEC1698142.1 TnsD family transposase [Schinkia azotoformans]